MTATTATTAGHRLHCETTLSTAMLLVDKMPVALRPVVETAMVVCLPSTAEPAPVPGEILDAAWCTRWRRCGPGFTGCRQALTAPEKELQALATVIEGLARDHGFLAQVNLIY